MIIDLLLHLSLVVVVASRLLVIRCRDSLHSLVVLEDARALHSYESCMQTSEG